MPRSATATALLRLSKDCSRTIFFRGFWTHVWTRTFLAPKPYKSESELDWIQKFRPNKEESRSSSGLDKTILGWKTPD
jgi:hypothetical protein